MLGILLGLSISLTLPGLYTILINQWFNDEIINTCIDIFQNDFNSDKNKKIMVYKTYLLKYIEINKFDKAHNIVNMLYGTIYKDNTIKFFEAHNSLLFVINSYNLHWSLL